MIILDLIKKIVDRIEGEEEKKDEIDECDTCGQFSRLKGGLCDWCQRTYESNK
jgi:hypothetical protein